MYRYSVDNAVTYTSEDITLFRESPFACWMERLTLENPDHGIPPDEYSRPPGNSMERQDELAETLRAEGKHISLIQWDAEEPQRRSATLEAMRRGTDFIVNGQLALGPLSGSANLLMRTSGYSELGNFLYIPCDTQGKTTLNSAFRLCFLADLLHSLQGQLPPQMLIIRGGSDLLPLETEDHIYHYRAVKHRFMRAMRDFRKHVMPDPAESSHFGRWSECANEVLKQRALRGEEQAEEIAEQAAVEQAAVEREPQAQSIPLQATAIAPAPEPPQVSQSDRGFGDRGIPVGDTLANQARRLSPRAFSTGGQASPSAGDRGSVMEAALQNLEFIGSSSRGHSIGSPARPKALAPAPPAEDEPPAVQPVVVEPAAVQPVAVEPAAMEPQQGRQVPETVAEVPPAPPSLSRVKPHPLDSTGFTSEPLDIPADVDSVESPPTALPTDSPEFEVDCVDDSDYQLPFDPMDSPLEASYADFLEAAQAEEEGGPELLPDPAPEVSINRPFPSSLNTAGFDDL